MLNIPRPRPKYPKGTSQVSNSPELAKINMQLGGDVPIPSIPFDCLQLMRLVHDIEFKLAGKGNMIALAIKQSIIDEPARATIDMIKDMATDNYGAVADVLGVKLTDRVLNSGLPPHVQTFTR